MNKKSINRCLETIALQNGVSIFEVKKEIQDAIDLAMSSPNPETQSQWRAIPCKGEKPTPEEVIACLAGKVIY